MNKLTREQRARIWKASVVVDHDAKLRTLAPGEWKKIKLWLRETDYKLYSYIKVLGCDDKGRP